MCLLKHLYNYNMLKHKNVDNTPKFGFEGQIKLCKCVKVIDGDSINIILSFNSKFYVINCRLNNIDTAELKSKNPKEKLVALQAKEYVETRLLNKIFKIRCEKFDKFGRLLITIFYRNDTLNNQLIRQNLGYEYKGKKKQEFNDWYN